MESNRRDPHLIDITMPALGADMSEGTLMEWQTEPGHYVKKGAIIAVIETSKGAIDMESYHSGTITELVITPGTTVPVGSLIATMTSEDSVNTNIANEAHSVTQSTSITSPTSSPEKAMNVTPSIRKDHSETNRKYISPIALKTALLSGIDLSALSGSGPHGAILLRDLHQTSTIRDTHSAQSEDSPPSAMSPMRQAISDAMTRSKREIPHYYLSLDIDLTKVQQWLNEQNQAREPEQRLLLPAVMITAIARKLARFPDLNGFYTNGVFNPAAEINIGNTISLRDGGLVIPAILNADTLSVDQVMDSLRELTERSRRGRLKSSEISSGTITVTSIGERGADSLTGVIYPPQVAIIGLGRLRQIPVVKNDQIEIGDVMTVTLAADHRVTDGITGAKFLHALSKQLQKPEDL